MSEPDATAEQKAIFNDIATLNFDLEAISWGAEELWHASFSYEKTNEQLSRCPLALLRLASIQVRRIYNRIDDLEASRR